MRQQIHDQKGNSFFGTHAQVRLYKAGWRCVERRKMGCIWIVRWLDPNPNGKRDESGDDFHDIWNQGTAFEILRKRELQAKIRSAQKEVHGVLDEIANAVQAESLKVLDLIDKVDVVDAANYEASQKIKYY